MSPQISKIATGILAVSSLAGVALSQLENKPFLYDWGGIEAYAGPLGNVWQPGPNLVSSLSWDLVPESRTKIPLACTGQFDDWLKLFKSEDFTVWEALYSDCPQPFYFCIHKDVKPALVQAQDLIKNWGMVPIGMRQYLAHVVVFPHTEASENNTAHQNGPQLAFKEDFANKFSTITHEISHSLDWYKSPTRAQGKRISESQEWKDAVSADSHVATVYVSATAASNGQKEALIEAFAEIGVMTTYNISSKGGLADFEKESPKVSRQLDFANQKFATDPVVGAVGCPAKVEKTAIVDKTSNLESRDIQVPEGTEFFIPTEAYADPAWGTKW